MRLQQWVWQWVCDLSHSLSTECVRLCVSLTAAPLLCCTEPLLPAVAACCLSMALSLSLSLSACVSSLLSPHRQSSRFIQPHFSSLCLSPSPCIHAYVEVHAGILRHGAAVAQKVAPGREKRRKRRSVDDHVGLSSISVCRSLHDLSVVLHAARLCFQRVCSGTLTWLVCGGRRREEKGNKNDVLDVSRSPWSTTLSESRFCFPTALLRSVVLVELFCIIAVESRLFFEGPFLIFRCRCRPPVSRRAGLVATTTDLFCSCAGKIWWSTATPPSPTWKFGSAARVKGGTRTDDR